MTNRLTPWRDYTVTKSRSPISVGLLSRDELVQEIKRVNIVLRVINRKLHTRYLDIIAAANADEDHLRKELVRGIKILDDVSEGMEYTKNIISRWNTGGYIGDER